MPLGLALPHVPLIASYLGFLDEMEANGDTVWPTRRPQEEETTEAFVARLRRQATAPAPGLVPHTVWWGHEGGVVAGIVVLRHELTPALREYGGHVSYEVRPSMRRRGVGTRLLSALLEQPEARAIGILRITCSPDNAGSCRIIEANGGELVARRFSDEAQRQTCIYEIRR